MLCYVMLGYVIMLCYVMYCVALRCFVLACMYVLLELLVTRFCPSYREVAATSACTTPWDACAHQRPPVKKTRDVLGFVDVEWNHGSSV